MPVTITFDVEADAVDVAAALTAQGYQVEQNSYVDLHWERGGGLDKVMGGITGSGKAALSEYGGEKTKWDNGHEVARIPVDFAIRNKTFAGDGIGIKQVGDKTVVFMDDSLEFQTRGTADKVKSAIREGLARKVVSKTMGIANTQGLDCEVTQEPVSLNVTKVRLEFDARQVAAKLGPKDDRTVKGRDSRRDRVQDRVRGR